MPGKYAPGTSVIFLRLPAEVKSQLAALAARKGKSVSELVREAIQQYLAKHKR